MIENKLKQIKIYHHFIKTKMTRHNCYRLNDEHTVFFDPNKKSGETDKNDIKFNVKEDCERLIRS